MSQCLEFLDDVHCIYSSISFRLFPRKTEMKKKKELTVFMVAFRAHFLGRVNFSGHADETKKVDG